MSTIAISLLLVAGCSSTGLDGVENSVNIVGENGETQTPSPTETNASNSNNGTVDIAKPAVPTKPSDFEYPELPTEDAFAMLKALATNTIHSTTTLGSLEKYTGTTQDGTVFNVTLAFDPTLTENNLAVFYDYPDGYEIADTTFSTGQLEGENKNIAKWLFGHQVLILAQSTGSVTAEVRDGYIEVVYNNNGIVDNYFYEDKVLVKRERIYPTDDPVTIRTIEYKRDGEVAELIAKIQ